MSDRFTCWRNAMAAEFGPIHENDPQPGYYRMRDGKGGAFVPVAIWHDGAGINALRRGRPVDPCSVWSWCCREPIAYETYVAVAERGEPWPDAVPAIGHNSAAFGLAPPERLAADIAALWTAARDWLAAAGEIATQALADKAANFAERFAAFEKQAEEQRTLEKKPALEAGRAIDAAWKPVIAAASEAKAALKQALAPFLRAEHERLAQDGGGRAEPPRAGTAGRRIGLRAVRSVKVTDRAAFEAGYRDDPRVWASADVHKLLLGLAEDDLAAGRAVAGAVLIETHVAA